MSEQEKQDKKKQSQAPKGGADKKARKPKAGPTAELDTAGADEPQQPAPTPRMLERYRAQIVPALQQQLGLKNVMAVPRLEKIVISMGLGKAVTSGEKGKLEQAEKELAVIAGQRPVRCKAKKSVANFKVREGQETGLKVTLRGGRMYEFLDRLIALAIPRVKDFRGLDPKGFDKAGNYNFGFNEQSVFPEVDVATVTFQQGMNITMVTTARSIEHGRELLKQFGMPFRDESKKD
ncbi:MAG: 50S ribosomal protein L5 [Phycisphaerales bacterium]|jgi:large subunit ribosomal protein L5|nr:50S ribosomal protein L5 [Phycisphaerales bacterium]